MFEYMFTVEMCVYVLENGDEIPDGTLMITANAVTFGFVERLAC